MIQDLVTKISENCFKVNQFITIVLDRALYAIIAQVCAGTRGSGLDSGEKQCINQCIGRYMDTMKVVSESIESKQKQ